MEKTYCKLCKTKLIDLDGHLRCKCKDRTLDNLRVRGIPNEWQGKMAIRRCFQITSISLDYSYL